MKSVVAALVLLALTCTATKAADPTVKVAIAEFNKGNGLLITYLEGLRDGIGYANSMMGGSALYCQPDKLALTVGQLMDVLKQFVAENPRIVEGRLGPALLFALTDAFPCPK